MAFGLHDNAADTDEVMHEINMTPLVDVMLVLLIIFIITVPVIKHAMAVDLPVASSQPRQDKPQVLQLSVDAQGRFYLGQQVLDATQLGLALQAQGAKATPPELHIHGDKAARYEYVAQAMSLAKLAGLRKLSFVTEPAP
jgi:biopolymer transport protein ExbD